MVEMRSLDPETTALSLMLAVISSSNTPLLLLDGDLRVIAASASFCRAFQLEPASVPKSQFSALGRGEWNVPQLTSLLEGTASGVAEVQAYEFDLKREGQVPRLLVMNARKLDYIDKVQIRLLLAVADVTDARASEKLKDNLLREKAEGWERPTNFAMRRGTRLEPVARFAYEQFRECTAPPVCADRSSGRNPSLQCQRVASAAGCV